MSTPPVCVVDDDVSVREAVESLLRAEGFEVELFASAERFMHRAVRAPISCIILDVKMPGVDGFDLQRELADAGIAVPIIFLTGHGSIPLSVRAIKAGAVEFLTKPFAVSLPIVMLAVDYFPLRRMEKRGAWHLVAEKWPVIALSATTRPSVVAA